MALKCGYEVEEEAVLALRRFVAALARLNRGSAERDGVTHASSRISRAGQL